VVDIIALQALRLVLLYFLLKSRAIRRSVFLEISQAQPFHLGRILDPALLALGTAIKALRKTHGISQEELAHRSHIDRSYMSSIERGMQNPGVMTVVQIAAGLGVSVAELAAKARL
jgi:DNA-binding XRE family transcriptional regulator